MLKKGFLTIRDYSHILLKRMNKTEETPYFIYFGLVLFPYYIMLCLILMIPLDSMGVRFVSSKDGEPFMYGISVLIFGGLYIFLIKYLLRWISAKPLPDELPERSTTRITLVLILIFLIGIFVFIPILGNLLYS